MVIVKVLKIVSKEEVKSFEDIKIIYSVRNNLPEYTLKQRVNYCVSTFSDFLEFNINNKPFNENYTLTPTSVKPKEGAVLEFEKLSTEKFNEFKLEKEEGSFPTTLIDVFNYLSSTNSEIRFNREFYNTRTGGVNFDLFLPDFSKSRINANDLVISNKKFNIVLNAIIEGNVQSDGELKTVTRYHPFKIVRQGKPVHTYIDVLLTTSNAEIKMIGEEIESGLIRINLEQFELYTQQYYNVDMLIYYKITHMILKAKSKGITKALEHMKEKLKEKKIFSKSVWYRGEPLEDEYISDAGSNTLDLWLQGKNKIISVDKIFTELDTLGSSLQNACRQLAVTESLTDNSDFYENALLLTNELKKEGSIDEFEKTMIDAYIISCTSLGDSLMERYQLLNNVYRTANTELNRIELLLMSTRYNISLNNRNSEGKVTSHFVGLEGRKVGVAKASSSYKGDIYQNYTLTVKQGIVTEPFKATDTSEWGRGLFISEDIEGI